MAALEVQIGSTITNGSSAMRVTERVDRDGSWGTPGWRGVNIALEQFGGNTGMTSFVPDYLVSGWRHVPFEWSPCVGAAVEERYVWSSDYRRLQREVRRVGADSWAEAEDMLDGMTGRYSSGLCELDDCGCSGKAHA